MARKTTAPEPAAAEAPAETPKRRSHGYNAVILLGRLVADPELRTTTAGTAFTRMRVATNDRGDAQFHDVVAWGRTAEIAAEYGSKGRTVFVEGRLNGRTWEAADGTKRRSVEVVLEQLELIGARSPEAPEDGE